MREEITSNDWWMSVFYDCKITSLVDQSLHFTVQSLITTILIISFESVFRSCNPDSFTQKLFLLFSISAFASFSWIIVQTMPESTGVFFLILPKYSCTFNGSASLKLRSSVISSLHLSYRSQSRNL